MCEKPPAMTVEQAREMCDTARKQGKVLAYDFHHRFALDTQQLREQVTNGVLERFTLPPPAPASLRRSRLGCLY